MIGLQIRTKSQRNSPSLKRFFWIDPLWIYDSYDNNIFVLGCNINKTGRKKDNAINEVLPR